MKYPFLATLLLVVAIISISPLQAQTPSDNSNASQPLPFSRNSFTVSVAGTANRTVLENDIAHGPVTLPARFSPGWQTQFGYRHQFSPRFGLSGGLGIGMQTFGFRTERLNEFLPDPRGYARSNIYKQPYLQARIGAHYTWPLRGKLLADVGASVGIRQYAPFPLNTRGERVSDSVTAMALIWNNPTKPMVKYRFSAGVLIPQKNANILRLGVAYDWSPSPDIRGSYWLLAGSHASTVGMWNSAGNGLSVEADYIFTKKKALNIPRTREDFAPKAGGLSVSYAHLFSHDYVALVDEGNFLTQRLSLNANGWQVMGEYAFKKHWRAGVGFVNRFTKVSFSYPERNYNASASGSTVHGLQLYGKYVVQATKRWQFTAQVQATPSQLKGFTPSYNFSYPWVDGESTERDTSYILARNFITFGGGVGAEYSIFPSLQFFVEGSMNTGISPIFEQKAQYLSVPTAPWKNATVTTSGGYWGVNIGLRARVWTRG